MHIPRVLSDTTVCDHERVLGITRTLSSLSILALALAACATSGDRIAGEAADPIEDTPTPHGHDAWAEQTFGDLEERLLEASAVEVQFRIESKGAVESAVEGTLTWTGAEALSLVAKGTFAGEPIDLALQADASSFSTSVGGSVRESGPRPAALVEAVAIGLTRMGLLHNIAVLVGGLPPDHAEGRVREWVEIGQVRLGEPELLGDAKARPLELAISVDDQWIGEATLWLAESGLPIEREQVMNFPEGQMRVTERYVVFVVED